MHISKILQQVTPMKQRTLSFVFLWTTVALTLWVFGIQAGVWLIAILAALTQFELYQLFEKMGLRPLKYSGSVCAPIIILGAYYMDGIDAGTNIFILCFIALVFAIVLKDLKAGRLRSFIPTLFGLLYVPYMLHFFIKLAKTAKLHGHADHTAILLAIWIIAVAKCTDVGGLIVGRKIGKTPLATISPKKTVEGAIGGIAFSIFVGLLILMILNNQGPEQFNWWRSSLMAIPIGIASITSDLIESALKRQANVKDSGASIPGIGGIFDLTDSLILTAPLGYLMFDYFIF